MKVYFQNNYSFLARRITDSKINFNGRTNIFDVFENNGTESVQQLTSPQGDIASLGSVIATPIVMNLKTQKPEKCLLLNQCNQKGGCYRLVKFDEKKLKYIDKIFKQNKKLFSLYEKSRYTISNLVEQEIWKNDLIFIKNWEDVVISEVAYTRLNSKDEKKRIDELGYKKNDETKDVICIENYIVYKDYYKDASKQVVVPLFKYFKENGETNLIIKAEAFGDKPVSPIKYYLRYGFKPLNKTMEEIAKHEIKTSKGMRISPDYTIVMYLPPDAILYNWFDKIYGGGKV